MEILFWIFSVVFLAACATSAFCMLWAVYRYITQPEVEDEEGE